MERKPVSNKLRREQSTARIIDAAIRNFGKYGYSKSAIATIAKDADVSPGLITNRYASKDELFEEAFCAAYSKIAINSSNISEVEEFLTATIDIVVNLYDENKDIFRFMQMIYTSPDVPSGFKMVAREEFINTKAYTLLCKAQMEGLIQKGDIVKLVDAFLAHTYIQVDMCKRFGHGVPSYDFFLTSIMAENGSGREYFNMQLINLLIKEFQSLWLIRVEDQSFNTYTYDNNKAAPHSIETAKKIKTYDEARLWYIENHVVDQHKNKVFEQSSIDFVLDKVKDGKPFFVEYGRKAGGEVNFNQLCYNRIINEDGEVVYISLGFRNIDIAKRSEIDDLTGAFTRRAFFSKAKEMLEWNPEKKYDAVISDIVDFKKINETYGIAVADQILKWEGEYLSTLGKDNLIIGRYGGDQIALFGTHEFIHKIMDDNSRKTFSKAERENGLPEISIKFGIYEDVPHDASVVSICDKAHMALNSIKHHYEKDMAYYNSDIKTQLEKQRRIEASMHESLENEDFKVYYQPKHDAITGKLVGAEALIRWIHPEYGFMSPADFIPLFEQNGFIAESDGYVWERTCKNLRRWIDNGVKVVPISVNASKVTITFDDIVENMKNSCLNNSLSSNLLHLEITETMMADDVNDLIFKLERIREEGFKVELDDFGSGYSSLNVLSTLPIDILKLDMSFMQQFGDEKRIKVLAACVNLAKELGFKTVSEGVELAEQQDALGKLGVDMIQGYLYSKPLPEDEFEKYMIEHLQ